MFRENVLTNDAIIDRIASTMVPVAVSRERAEDSRTPEGRFLQAYFKRHPPQGSPCIYAPDGRVLGAFRGFGDMAGRMQQVIDRSLHAFGAVKPRRAVARDTHPYRGKGVMPDGGICLAEYVRPAKEALAELHTKTPVVSSVNMTQQEFRGFAPPRAVVGTKWTVKEETAKKLARVSSPLCFQHAPRPDWVTTVIIDAEVRGLESGRASLRYHGRIASQHRKGSFLISAQETTLTGEGVYDVETGRLQSVLFVGSGVLRWAEAPEKRVAFDALVEWSRESPSSSGQPSRNLGETR